MSRRNDDGDVLARVAELAGATRATRGERIQSLWSGYGELFRAHLDGSPHHTAIVKWVRPPPRAQDDVGGARKRRSYEVEATFYRSFAYRCDAHCRVATPLGVARDDDGWLFVLEDLDASHPRRVHAPRAADLDACIAWLAAFHARFVGRAPDGLWRHGTYWHLGTRRDELARRNDPALTARAQELDHALRTARHVTIVHGDAKPDNFCHVARGHGVAAVDFQYAGGGPGIRDVAYLLHGEDVATERRALDHYFDRLASLLSEARDEGSAPDVADLVSEWRDLYPVAVADFERFLVCWRR